jgi:hypothetical protein
MEKVIKFDKFLLLLGNHSLDLFDYFKVDKLHGLTRKDAMNYNETPEDAYIYGMANYSPSDKFPYVFINLMRLNGTYKDITGIMHETIHISLLLHNWDIKNKEEQIVTDAENYANDIVLEVIEYKKTKQ